VVPHGGPHSTTPTSFVPSYSFLAAETHCAVLHVNYRGSLGFGAHDLNSLPGKIGEQDVADVILATRTALAILNQQGAAGGATGGENGGGGGPAPLPSPLLDRGRVAVVGGSHGGFLGAHLIGQHPGLFKVAALRNPVTNIPAMAGTTDIPDWCSIEALGLGTYDFTRFGPCKPAALAGMFDRSPIKHMEQVRAPTLLALGAKDRRVPCSQGVEFHHALKSQNVPTRLLMYPEDTHAIDRPASEADHWLNIAAWLNNHLK